MRERYADALFTYIRAILYEPSHARLDAGQFPEMYRKLAEGLVFLDDCIRENREFSNALASGNLDVPLPNVENTIAAPAKALHGALSHLTWQTTQVANGDYSQRLDFMGDFSAAFNHMVAQLSAARDSEAREKESILRHARELKQNQDLLIELINETGQCVIVLSKETDKVLYLNKASPAISVQALVKCLASHPLQLDQLPRYWESTLINESAQSVFLRVTSHEVVWQGQAAIAHLVTDITSAKQETIEMKRLAFHDALTGIYNRRYGMRYAQKLIDENEPFFLVFADLDYLKYCNDEFGHEYGNAYIIDAAKALDGMRLDKTVCRIGGDEFMLLIRNAPEEKIRGELESARQALRDTQYPAGYLYHRSFSYGLCERTLYSRAPLTDIMTSADKQMYTQKAAHKRTLLRAGGQTAANP